MAILTGPDFLLPPYELASDKSQPEEKRTQWHLRQLDTAAAIAGKEAVVALANGRPLDPKRLDDLVRACLVGWERLFSGGAELAYEEEDNKRSLFGEKPDRVVAAHLMRRLPLTWKVELITHAVAPQLTSDDVGN